MAADAAGNREQVRSYSGRAALLMEVRRREHSYEPAAKADLSLLVDDQGGTCRADRSN